MKTASVRSTLEVASHHAAAQLRRVIGQGMEPAKTRLGIRKIHEFLCRVYIQIGDELPSEETRAIVRPLLDAIDLLRAATAGKMIDGKAAVRAQIILRNVGDRIWCRRRFSSAKSDAMGLELVVKLEAASDHFLQSLADAMVIHSELEFRIQAGELLRLIKTYLENTTFPRPAADPSKIVHQVEQLAGDVDDVILPREGGAS